MRIYDRARTAAGVQARRSSLSATSSSCLNTTFDNSLYLGRSSSDRCASKSPEIETSFTSSKLVVAPGSKLEAEMVERLSEVAIQKRAQSLRLLQEREEQRKRNETKQLEINAKSRQLASKRGEQDISLRLHVQAEVHRRKVEVMRQEAASKELECCANLSIGENSRLLASKWVQKGDVFTRLCKLGHEKKQQSLSRVQDAVCKEREAVTASFTADQHSQELGVSCEMA